MTDAAVVKVGPFTIKIKGNQIFRAASYVWKDFSQFQLDEYFGLITKEECISFLSDKFQIIDDEKGSIIKDLYFYTLEFAKRNNFSPSQASAVFSIVKETNKVVSANPKLMLDKDYAYFKNLLLLHSIQRPPYSEKIFNYKTMMLILDYVTNTYFRHYLMYKYVFTKKIRLQFAIENFMPAVVPSRKSIAEPAVAADQVVTNEVVPETSTPVSEEAPETQVHPEITDPSAVKIQPPIETPILVPAAEPIKSPRHEAALTELKSFITSILATKLDEIKTSVAQKIQGGEEKSTVGDDVKEKKRKMLLNKEKD